MKRVEKRNYGYSEAHEHQKSRTYPKHMGGMLLVPVAVLVHWLGHLHERLNSIGTGILAYFCKIQICSPVKVITLECQLNMVQVNRVFCSGYL